MYAPPLHPHTPSLLHPLTPDWALCLHEVCMFYTALPPHPPRMCIIKPYIRSTPPPPPPSPNFSSNPDSKQRLLAWPPSPPPTHRYSSGSGGCRPGSNLDSPPPNQKKKEKKKRRRSDNHLRKIKVTAAARAALSFPASVCSIFVCPNNGMASSVWNL